MKFKVTLYPNVSKFTTIVEAESIEEAVELAEETAKDNCGFIATKEDVEVIEESQNDLGRIKAESN